MMKILSEDLFGIDLTRKSSGREISLSSTYLVISSRNGFPYFFALPSPTPWHLMSSSNVSGYIMDMSSMDESLKIIQGWRWSLLPSSRLRSFNIDRSCISPPPAPFAGTGASSSSSSSALPSEKLRSAANISSVGAAANARPSSVTETSPYESMFLFRKCLIIP